MKPNNILIVYFSGTFGTKRAALELEKSFLNNNVPVDLFALDLSINKSFDISYEYVLGAEMLFIMYPVHAFDAPKPIYEWIKKIPDNSATRVCVISVSAGGKVGMNTTSRTYVKKELQKKGIDVVYEKMLVMPSNFATTASENINLHLLKSLNQKTDVIVKDVIAGKIVKESTKFSAIVAKTISNLENHFCKRFGKSLKANENCTKCNWCVNNCPTNNIKMLNDKIKFNDKCVICMRCIYGCPVNAIEAKKFSFAVIKDGFNLENLEQKIAHQNLKPIDENSEGWNGAVEYILKD